MPTMLARKFKYRVKFPLISWYICFSLMTLQCFTNAFFDESIFDNEDIENTRMLSVNPRHSKHSHLRIAICDFDTREVLASPSRRNHATYAKVNGYTYYRGVQSDLEILKETGRTSHWLRFHYISELLRDHDWVLWIDSDAMFVNFSYTVETVLRTHRIIDSLGQPDIADIPHEKSIIFAGDLCSINTGVMLFRNTHFATHILIPEVWAIGARMIELGLVGEHHMNYDNGAFIIFLAGCTSTTSLEGILHCFNHGCVPETTFHNTQIPIDYSVYNATIPSHILKHLLPVSQPEFNSFVPEESKFVYHFAHGGRRAFKRIEELSKLYNLPHDPDIDAETEWSILTHICLFFDPSGSHCEFTMP